MKETGIIKREGRSRIEEEVSFSDFSGLALTRASMNFNNNWDVTCPRQLHSVIKLMCKNIQQVSTIYNK